MLWCLHTHLAGRAGLFWGHSQYQWSSQTLEAQQDRYDRTLVLWDQRHGGARIGCGSPGDMGGGGGWGRGVGRMWGLWEDVQREWRPSSAPTRRQVAATLVPGVWGGESRDGGESWSPEWGVRTQEGPEGHQPSSLTTDSEPPGCAAFLPGLWQSLDLLIGLWVLCLGHSSPYAPSPVFYFRIMLYSELLTQVEGRMWSSLGRAVGLVSPLILHVRCACNSGIRLLCPWGLSRQEYWSGLPCLSPGGLPNPGIKAASLISPALVGGFLTPNTTWGAPRIP